MILSNKRQLLIGKEMPNLNYFYDKSNTWTKNISKGFLLI